jgi:hypothetical protein
MDIDEDTTISRKRELESEKPRRDLLVDNVCQMLGI